MEKKSLSRLKFELNDVGHCTSPKPLILRSSAEVIKNQNRIICVKTLIEHYAFIISLYQFLKSNTRVTVKQKVLLAFNLYMLILLGSQIC